METIANILIAQEIVAKINRLEVTYNEGEIEGGLYQEYGERTIHRD